MKTDPADLPEPVAATDGYGGLVKKEAFSLPVYTTIGGRLIRELRIGWESYGRLNDAKDNVVIVPHSYSSNSHAAGRYARDDTLPGYWDSIIGPRKAIDTDRFYVISADSLVNLNSKDGITVTTGPASIDPQTGRPYGLSFPIVTIPDFVRVQKALLDALGIRRIHAAVGLSMGGLQCYEWAAAYPDMVDRIVVVDAATTQSPFRLAELSAWAAAIRLDPHWNNGDYYGGPEPLAGVALSFYNILLSARHPEYAAAAFGYHWRDPDNNPLDALENDFFIEQSFRRIGQMRADLTTDANHMLYMARANQLFIAGTAGSSVDPALKKIRAKTLILQSRTDRLFPPGDAEAETARIRGNGVPAEYREIDSIDGHLGGLSDIAKLAGPIRDFLERP